MLVCVYIYIVYISNKFVLEYIARELATLQTDLFGALIWPLGKMICSVETNTCIYACTMLTCMYEYVFVHLYHSLNHRERKRHDSRAIKLMICANGHIYTHHSMTKCNILDGTCFIYIYIYIYVGCNPGPIAPSSVRV